MPTETPPPPELPADTPAAAIAEPQDEAPPASTIPLVVAADVQDHLIAACNDLQRLQVLLADAAQVLMSSFHTASMELSQHRRRRPERELATVLHEIQLQLDNAVTALQFHDMTSQLIGHVQRRIGNVDGVMRSVHELSDAAAHGQTTALLTSMVSEALEKLIAADSSNPVAQQAFREGEIELF